MGSDSFRRLLHVGRSLVTELDPEAVLDRVLHEARAVTSARYAAIGVLNEARTELERFIAHGFDEATERAIGDRPRGRGVLGLLIMNPRPLRLADIGRHPYSYGFPIGHPVMRSFLGVPIMVRGQAWGNLYLTEKEGGGEFTAEDEEAVVVLAEFAATAIDNARRYERAERQRQELEAAVRGLQAACEVADAIGSPVEPTRVLELIVKRGRALLDARSVIALMPVGDELVVAAAAGNPIDAGDRWPALATSMVRAVLEHGVAQRVSAGGAPRGSGRDGQPASLLLVPMTHRGVALGALAAWDRDDTERPFTDADEQMLCRFAASVANVLAIAHAAYAGRAPPAQPASDGTRLCADELAP